MKLLPYLRPFATAALAAGLLAWCVPTHSLRADDETTASPEASGPVATEAPPPPAEPASPPAAGEPVAVEGPEAPATEVESSTAPAPSPEAAATDGAPGELRRLHELITIMNDAHLRADESTPEMVTVFGSATIDGRVDGDCVTVFGNVTVNGVVRGDLVCVMGQVTLGPGAEVRGETVAVGGGVVADPTAHIRGEKVAITIPGIGAGFGGWLGDWFRDGLGKARILPHTHPWAWGAAVVFVLLNLLFAAAFGGAVRASARALEERPVLSFVNGALVLLFFPVLLVLLCVSVVGIMLVPVANAALFLCWFIGTIGVFFFCGRQFGLGDRPVPAVLVGNLIFLALYALPVIGLAVWSVTALLGLGAAVTAMGQRRRDAKAARAAAQRPPAPPEIPLVPPVPPVPPVSPPAITPQVYTTPTQPVWMAPPGPVAGGAAQGSLGFTGSNPETPPVTTAADAGAASATLPPLPGWTPPAAAAAGPAPSVPLPPVDDAVRRATFWPRLGAFAVDFFAVTIAANYLDVERVLPFILIAYHTVFWGWRSTTPGGIVFNLRVVRVDGSPMTYGVAAVRAIGGVFSLLPAGLGFVWVNFDRELQAWHDKLAGTYVETVRRATPLI